MSDVIQVKATATIEVEALQEDGVTALDLSAITPTADNLKIIFNGPKGTVILTDGASTPAVIFTGTGLDGKFRVVLQPNTIVVEGPWQYQGYAKKPTGEEYWSEKFNFEAEDNLPES